MPQPETTFPAPEFAIAAPSRVCKMCKFRRLSSDFAAHNSEVCKFCSEAKMVQVARQERLEKAKDVFDHIVNEAGIQRGKYTLDDVATGQIDEMGGLRAWLTSWRMQFQHAMDDKPGSKVVLDQFTNTAKLIGMAQRLRHEEHLIDLKDEELELLKQRELKKLIGMTEAAAAQEEIMQAVHDGITPADLPDDLRAFSVEDG